MDYHKYVERRQQIEQMKKDGYRTAFICKHFGISRQRMHKILKEPLKSETEYTRPSPLLETIPPEYRSYYSFLIGIGRTRFFVRLRDNFTCQTCGIYRPPSTAKQKTHRRQLDCHHINGKCGKLSRAYEKMDAIPDMITLCHRCHFQRHDHSKRLNKPKTAIPNLVSIDIDNT